MSQEALKYGSLVARPELELYAQAALSATHYRGMQPACVWRARTASLRPGAERSRTRLQNQGQQGSRQELIWRLDVRPVHTDIRDTTRRRGAAGPIVNH